MINSQYFQIMKKLFLLAALMSATLMLFAQPTGSKGGKFTVASGVQVRFSQGNLQFNVSQGTHQTADGSQKGTWRFAENQYDTIGKSNTNIIVENYTGWISLFGWGTSGYNGKSPMMYVYDNAQYGDGTSDIAGTNYDWGVYNAISNGGNKPGLWRTPTREEYSYMLKNRANAEKLWSRGEVNGIDGFIFLPDDWTLPAGITFTPKAHYYDNVYTIEQWTQLENNGAIFIPKEGRQNYSTSNYRMEYTTGSHYVATGSCKSTTQRYVLSGSQTDPTGTSCSTFRYMGVPVRLVRTVEEFTVTFKNWDGTTLKSENVEYGFAATPPTDLVREGWTFTGWTASVSGMSKDYITDEVTFTAQYEKYITYTVTFVDGATNEIIKTETVKKGENATAPTVPSHLGWTFTGWDKSFTNVQSDLVVTAQYTWDETDGRLNGKFSVAAGKQVYFAKGNLRYQPSNNRWRFAGYQYDWAGVDANTHVGESDYDGWIDLFGWSNTTNNFGVTAGWEGNEYSGVFVDWGDNPIENGGNKQYAWYTLTSAEWDYLFNTRTDAASKYSFVTVNGLRGMIILPDSWTKPSSISFTAKATSYDTNTYSANQWELLEANGAVFLPQTGDREETTVQSYGTTVIGMYRVGNPGGTRQDANVLLWMKSGNSYYIDAASGQPEYKGYSVRLARPVEMCSKTSSFTASAIGSYVWEGRAYTTSGAFTRNFRTAQGCDSVVTMVLTITQEQPAEGTGLLSGLFSVSADHQAQFSQGNLQYQPLTNSWRFATNQYDLIGQDNSHITEAAYGGWIDLFAWSCTGNNDYGIMRDISSYSISGDFVDWGNNAVLNGGNRPHFWQTLSVEEWEYILTERANADNLWGCATVNTIHGVILLPDSWTTPAGLTFVPSSKYYASNIFTPAQWAQMESAGAVFLPAAGSYGIWPELFVDEWNLVGAYFAADKNQTDGAYGMGTYFRGSPYIRDINFGSVRLVRMGECVAKTTSITETRCDSYVWDGTTYTESGDYQKSYVTSTGCDSIVTLHLTINKSYETGFGEQAETSYTWQGTTYTESGDYTKTLQSVAGCDSIVTLHLTIGSDDPDDPEDPEQKWANGVLPGKFSVSAGKQVHFSQGNLQYKASTDTWQFAQQQTDYVGDDNVNISPTYDGWIDLFGWGTGNNPTLASTNKTDYAVFTDWGVNAISNGGNETNLWRTLTAAEILYLFTERPNAASLVALGKINNENGIILLPDDWVTPSGSTVYTMSPDDWGVSTDNFHRYYDNNNTQTKNNFNITQWAVLEEAGAVFLPYPGRRRYKDDEGVIRDYAGFGFYWTSTKYSNNYNYAVKLSGSFNSIIPNYNGLCTVEMGLPVRLVHEIESACTDKTSEFSASAETSYTWEGTTYTESGDYTKTLQTVAGCDSIVTLHLTIGGEELIYDLRICGTRVKSTNCSDLSVINGVTGTVSYDPGRNVLTLENATLTTPDVTQAIWNQIPNLKIVVKGACDLNTPYCIALRIDANTTIEGSNADASLKVRNAGPLDHAIGSVAAGTCYTALSTFNNASLTIKDCEVETEGAGGILLQGSSQLTVNHARLTALTVGTPTSTAQQNVMRSFKASVAPVLINCELLAPAGVTFSTTLGGYTTDGSTLTREKVIIGYNESCTDKTSEFSETAEGSYTWNGTVYNESGDYTQTFPMANGCDSVVTLHLTITEPSVNPVGNLMWRADDDDIKGLGTITENTTVRGLTFVATASKTIIVDENKKTYDTLTFTHRIKLGGTIAADNRHLRFDVGGSTKIEIYAISASSSTTRVLNLAAGAYNSNLQQFNVTGTEVNYLTYNYTGAATTLYLGSNKDGINILAINISGDWITDEPCTPVNTEFTETAEGSYTWNGTTYTASGDYEQTFTMANGCDSVVTLHLTITEPQQQTVEYEVAYVCDFSTQATKHNAYGDSWVYDNSWTVYGGSNYNAAWTYCKMGGKNSTLAGCNPVYIAAVSPFSKDIRQVKVYINKGPVEGLMTINEWGVDTYSDGSFLPDSRLSVVLGAEITGADTITIAVDDANATAWDEGAYFRVYWDLSNTSSTNGIIWVDKIEFLAEKNGQGTAAENIVIIPKARKIIRDNHVIILLPDGTEYNVLGEKLK